MAEQTNSARNVQNNYYYKYLSLLRSFRTYLLELPSVDLDRVKHIVVGKTNCSFWTHKHTHSLSLSAKDGAC